MLTFRQLDGFQILQIVKPIGHSCRCADKRIHIFDALVFKHLEKNNGTVGSENLFNIVLYLRVHEFCELVELVTGEIQAGIVLFEHLSLTPLQFLLTG